jgi:hypothetical protein
MMKSTKALALAALYLLATGLVFAKLPPLTDEQKAKAEEAKATADAVAKKDAELLAKAQDRVASHYIQQQKAKGITVKPAPIANAPASAVAAAATVAPAARELSATPLDAPPPAKKK